MKENKGMYINIIIAEAVCMIIVLLSVLVIKYFFKTEFKNLKKWYTAEITADTTVQEVIG